MSILKQIDADLKSGKYSVTELTQSVLQNIKSDNNNAFIESFDSSALNTANQLDSSQVNQQAAGLVKGLPVGIKDNMCLEIMVLRVPPLF